MMDVLLTLLLASPLAYSHPLAGLLPLSREERAHILETKPFSFVNASSLLPASFDARERWPGCIGPVLDQGTCGSCWAISSISVMSDRLCIEKRARVEPNATRVALSALQLTSCDSGGGFFAPNWLKNKGCQGGQPWAAFEYAEKTRVGGMVSDKCFPYLQSNGGAIGTCKDEPCLTFQKTPTCPDKETGKAPPNSPACNGGSSTWAKNLAAPPMLSSYIVQLTTPMMHEIFTYGPIVATMGVYEDLLNFTGDGVYQQESDKAVGAHAVAIVGWGTWIDPKNTTKRLPYWSIRNSWTNSWGDEGYFKILRGDDSCECDICNMCSAGLFYGNHTNLTPPLREEGTHT